MRRLKSFAISLLGGALGAALVVLVLVVVFGFGTTATPLNSDFTATNDPRPLQPAAAAGMTPEQIYRTLSGGVVMILSEFDDASLGPFGQSGDGQALGTGFVVDGGGYILTNAHVVSEGPAGKLAHGRLQEERLRDEAGGGPSRGGRCGQ